MEVIRVEGSDLVKNCVYNIYKKDREDNYHPFRVWLVISENNRNNQQIRLRELKRIMINGIINNWETTKSTIYGTIPANLTGVDLTRVDLTEVDLTHAHLTGANLTRANLTDANLTSANLTDVTLTGVDLTRATLTGADLTGAILTGVIGYNE